MKTSKIQHIMRRQVNASVLTLALTLMLLLAALLCVVSLSHLSMTSSSSSARRSTRTSQPPLTLADEQAASMLSRLEERDLDAALLCSLHDSWEDAENVEAEIEDAIQDEEMEDETEEKKEEKQQAAAVERKEEWSTHLHDIHLDPPRLRSYVHGQPKQIPPHSTPLQLLQLFLPPQLIQEFVNHTNAAAPFDWRHTTVEELYAFIGVHLCMGIDRLPRLHMYWSEQYNHTFITSLFSRDRFKQLLRFFRIVAPDPAPPQRDPLPHIQSLAETLNQSFAAHYSPASSLTLDETMVAFKGRSSIKQYIPSKPHKWGYKIYSLASDDYLLHFEVYEGKEEAKTAEGSTFHTVMRMIDQYQNRSHILYCDNWFTSPLLLDALKQKGIRVCGSVRRNRKGLPALSVDDTDALNRGDWLQQQKGDTSLAVWKDQKLMWVLYNHISPLETATLDRWNDSGHKISIGCPKAVRDYFYQARSVDVINQLHYSYRTGRKSVRVWSRLAWWLIDMCIINAFKLWSFGQEEVRQLDFREQLMLELVELLPANQRQHRERAQACPVNASAKDHYSFISSLDRDCVVCSHQPQNRKRTNYICAKCGVHLCLGDCFSQYHSNQ
jgi:hypothetical protein